MMLLNISAFQKEDFLKERFLRFCSRRKLSTIFCFCIQGLIYGELSASTTYKNISWIESREWSKLLKFKTFFSSKNFFVLKMLSTNMASSFFIALSIFAVNTIGNAQEVVLSVDNVAMYSNGYDDNVGYWTYTRNTTFPSPPTPPENPLIPYPAGSWSMHATGDVYIVSTLENSEFTVNADGTVHVESIGDASTFNLTANGDVSVKSIGDASTLIVTKCYHLYVESSGIGSKMVLFVDRFLDISSTGEDSTLTAVVDDGFSADGFAKVRSTGDRSNVDIHASKNVEVSTTGLESTLNFVASQNGILKSTGIGSTSTVAAGPYLYVFSTGDHSKITGTYEGFKFVYPTVGLSSFKVGVGSTVDLQQAELVHVFGNVDMDSNGYLKYTGSPPTSPGSLTPYPIGSWTMHATGTVNVISTLDESRVTVAGTSVEVKSTGLKSNVNVMARTSVKVKSTGNRSKFYVIAGTSVNVESTGDISKLYVLAKRGMVIMSTGHTSKVSVVANHVSVDTTGRKSILIADVGTGARVNSTGPESSVNLVAGNNVHVESTGFKSAVNLVAGNNVYVSKTGNQSTVTGTYEGSLILGVFAIVDLQLTGTTMVHVEGHVAMYSNGYLKYAGTPPITSPSEESLTPYPTGPWSMHATKVVNVFSTLDESIVDVAGPYVSVRLTGDASTLNVIAGVTVYVSLTGEGSTLNVVAGLELIQQ